MEGVEARLVAIEAKFDRMIELVQQEFLHTRGEIAALRAEMDQRFNAVDERFAELRIELDERFAASRAEMDERFATSRAEMDERFAASRVEMDERFATSRVEVDERFATSRVELDERFATSRVELDERFRSVTDRLDLSERQLARNTAAMGEMQSQLDKLRNDVHGLETGIDRLQKSVDGLADDMRQRFRIVNERLAGVEKRLAA